MTTALSLIWRGTFNVLINVPRHSLRGRLLEYALGFTPAPRRACRYGLATTSNGRCHVLPDGRRLNIVKDEAAVANFIEDRVSCQGCHR